MENLFLQQFLELLDTGAWSASTATAVEEAGGLSYLQAGLRARRWPRPRYRRKEIPCLATYQVAFRRCYQCLGQPRGVDSAVHNSLWVLLLQGDLERIELLNPQPADYVEVFCRALDLSWAGHVAELVEPRLDAACTRRRLMLRLCKRSLSMRRLDLFCKLLTRLELTDVNHQLLVLPLAWAALKADPEGTYLEPVLTCPRLAVCRLDILTVMVACVVREWGLNLTPTALQLLLGLRAHGVSAVAFVPAVYSLERLQLVLDIEPQFPLESMLEGLFEKASVEVLERALQRVSPSQRPHPLKLARAAQRGANLAGIELLEILYPQLSLETAVHRGSPGGPQISDQGISKDRDLICNRVLARARRLWKQFLPLMRAMVVEVAQQRILSLRTRIELGLLSDEARWTMLSWWVLLTKTNAYPTSELSKIWVCSATPGLLQNYLRGLFQQGLGQEILLGLGFADPVNDVPSYNLYQAARFCVAYGRPAWVVHLLKSGRLTPGQLHALQGVAANYGRAKMLLLLKVL